MTNVGTKLLSLIGFPFRTGFYSKDVRKIMHSDGRRPLNARDAKSYVDLFFCFTLYVTI
jgi:hypothetical protein